MKVFLKDFVLLTGMYFGYNIFCHSTNHDNIANKSIEQTITFKIKNDKIAEAILLLLYSLE